MVLNYLVLYVTSIPDSLLPIRQEVEVDGKNWPLKNPDTVIYNTNAIILS